MGSIHPDMEKQAFLEKDIFYQIGRTLQVWQEVEEQHFKLFFLLLGTPNLEAASVAYYSNESFQVRHNIVTRLAEITIKGDMLPNEWNGPTGLQKTVKDANGDRNKLAHYRVTPEEIVLARYPDGRKKVAMFGDPKLQPHHLNIVSQMLGWLSSNPKHNLGSDDIWRYAFEWSHLSFKLNDFQQRLPLPLQLTSHALFLGTLEGRLDLHPQRQAILAQPNTEPSAQ